MKNYSIVGLHWGPCNRYDRRPWLSATAISPRWLSGAPCGRWISERLALDEVADGVQRLADGGTVGRVVYVRGAAR